MIKVATVELHLDDPVDKAAFEQFLDQPIFSTSEEHISAAVKTPSQILEDAILSYIHEAEAELGGTLSVRAKLHRGSFTIGLTFFAAYEFLAQYHDFVESVGTIRRQIRELVQDASKWYRQQTGRDICVRSDVSVEPPIADVRDNGGLDGQSRSHTQSEDLPTQSTIEIQHNQDATSNVNDVRINVQARGPHLLLWLIITAIIVLSSLTFGLIYCRNVVGANTCVEYAATIVATLRNWIR